MARYPLLSRAPQDEPQPVVRRCGTIVVGMPRARRRRRGRRPARRSVGAVITTSIIILVLGVLIVGSVVEIDAQSAPYRRMTDQGYAQLASPVIEASNQTGARLAAVINAAPTIPNQRLPNTARGEIQQGLDAAVSTSSEEARQAKQLTPPTPSDDVAQQLTAIFADRAAAVVEVARTIDQLLGMAPLSIAGAPNTTTTSSSNSAALISVGQAAHQLAAGGTQIERTDRAYAALAARLRHGNNTGSGPIRLPASIWAPPGAPLSSTQLGDSAAPLIAAVALVPFHQMVITAVGLTPPAVPAATPNDAAESGIIGTSCDAPNSTVAGPTPTRLPPTSTVTPLVTVTDCGTVDEANVMVTETLALAEPTGAVPPPVGASGSSARTMVNTVSGQSQSLSLPALNVAKGHNYTLTVTLTPPTGQADRAGTSQQFLLQIVS